ncbi:aldehyde dehydrogenase family protein [Neptunomonas sp.]|uniref:aldehyde dehydrogenase family protein n=1 Tax=Neptunomonas sp. TaxID=1971898 RepID=UPI003569511A
MKTIDKLYINGQWYQPDSSELLLITNPATEELCASVPKGNEKDVEIAIAAARQALQGWATTSAKARADLLIAAAKEMENRYDDLVEAHVVTMGCPRSIAGAYHVDAAIEGMRYYANLAQEMEVVKEKGNVLLLKEPVGVCAFINPWNYPLHQLTGKVAPALAAGCTIITKPAEQTPLPDFIMAEIFHKIGLPAGVFNLVTGSGRDIGPLMSSHPQVDMVSFTGSTAAGVNVAIAAAPTVKRVCQELGGKSALIITEDADLEAAVRYGVEDVMANTGQTCNALTRMFVPLSQYEQAVKLAASIALEQKVGDPLDESTTMGPMASQRQRETVLKYIRLGIEEGARLVTGGLNMPEGLMKGAYVKPTIFADVTNEMIIAREEIFGPVLCMLAYDDIEQAITMANDTIYGLSSGVFAKDQGSALKIARRLQAGQCYIQGSYFSTEAPFGGYKQSGNGREWGEQGMHEYIETKAIICG